MHLVPGGEFPVPTAAVGLVQSIPPPGSYSGPFVVVDELMDQFRNWTIPDGNME